MAVEWLKPGKHVEFGGFRVEHTGSNRHRDVRLKITLVDGTDLPPSAIFTCQQIGRGCRLPADGKT